MEETDFQWFFMVFFGSWVDFRALLTCGKVEISFVWNIFWTFGWLRRCLDVLVVSGVALGSWGWEVALCLLAFSFFRVFWSHDNSSAQYGPQRTYSGYFGVFLPPKRTRKRRRKSLACDGFKIVHGALAGFAKSSTKFHKSVFAFRFGRKSVHFKDLQHSLFLEMWNR